MGEEEQYILLHLMYDRLIEELRIQGVDHALLETIVKHQNTPEIEHLLSDAIKAFVMTIARHKRELSTFEKLERSLRASSQSNDETPTLC